MEIAQRWRALRKSSGCFSLFVLPQVKPQSGSFTPAVTASAADAWASKTLRKNSFFLTLETCRRGPITFYLNLFSQHFTPEVDSVTEVHYSAEGNKTLDFQFSSYTMKKRGFWQQEGVGEITERRSFRKRSLKRIFVAQGSRLNSKLLMHGTDALKSLRTSCDVDHHHVQAIPPK